MEYWRECGLDEAGELEGLERRRGAVRMRREGGVERISSSLLLHYF